ncbi:UDP-N-acetylmuramoyl-L-alanine--D-glutamate ligase [Estrella lausannensis]|uniref:UDP-N-acetylmuramoylalanine--D-glutamate ligase n=1 Tax=Estrella lausannensis TaxID=483423 RepID=A0A0H5DSM5_9BACT|nr:UDP-N-acetylmuramoyl-L-alanine--D-glutamate ligase [Estrella lausannensis]CRX39313.1 UDP-N-acetylmuramoylalanine--D-glutamate ligase [Estrella lausannensis]
MERFKTKRVLIAGLGKSGKSACRWLLNKGASLFCFDDQQMNKEHDPEAKELIGKGLKMVSIKSALEDSFDMMVVSPGFPRTHAVYEKFIRESKPVIGEMELAFCQLDKKAVGVTGTNGKTTVVSKIAHCLKDNGIKGEALGNIGTPLLQAVERQGEIDVFVVEISSYQLETLTTARLSSGCILNITPDHLDRYSSMEEYALTKGLMGRVVVPEGRLYVEEKTLKSWGKWIDHPGTMAFGFSPECDVALVNGTIRRFGVTEIRLPDEFGRAAPHDLENMLASYALLRDLDLSAEDILRSFKAFKKPPHRIEFIREVQGVSFFDDSKGTNVDAVLKAVSSMEGRVLLIAGGVDKGASYTLWIPHFQGKVVKIIAIGEAREKIKNELSTMFPVELCSSLQEAVDTAFRSAKKGDSVLLSPGCSSFDMFRDYKHRGDEFKKIVLTL